MGFQSVSVPQGATIASAQLVIDGIRGFFAARDAEATPVSVNPFPGSGTASCDIAMEDADTATSITTPAIADGLDRTTAKVNTYQHDLDEYNTGDAVTITGLGPLVQEVVDRPGWVSGNDMQLLFDEDGTSDSNEVGTNQWGIMATANDTEEFPSTGFDGARLEIGWS